ncbi:hypothetical protein [Leeuwenhoekiella sp. NPDC079379]|uniref:hypothetical protein n=1 Tax=Leeuwenhoekiella sp. NPDC079379 TaxID=3364122 RepID=UPI0037C9B7C7
MNLKYEGKNTLIKSAVNRADLILRSPFFQEQLLNNLNHNDALKFQKIIDDMNNSDSDKVHITTFWNPFKKECIIEPKNMVIGLNTALLKKSRSQILHHIIKNYSKLYINNFASQLDLNEKQFLDRRIKMITQAYA